MKKLGIIVVLFFMCKNIVCDIIQDPPTTCVDLRAQNNLDTDQLLGIWYGNEIIMHLKDLNSELPLDSCVEISLADITNSVHRMYDPSQRPNYRYLRLVWNDGNNAFEHILLYNKTIRGVWIAKPTPTQINSNAMTKQNFGQFTGTIQVMKVVGNHMVLNFCENDGRLFSIALARSTNMYTAEDLASVHTLLQRKGLFAYSPQRLCSGFARHNISVVILFFAIFACIFKHF